MRAGSLSVKTGGIGSKLDTGPEPTLEVSFCGKGAIVTESFEHVLALCSGCISHRLCPLMDVLGASFYQSLSCVWGFLWL